MIRASLTLVLALLLTACSTPAIEGEQYLETSPDFTLERFFDGEVKAWGIVQDRSGNLTQRFEADIIGTWDGTTLVLDETFEYGLGEGPTARVWTITKNPDGSYAGSAGDIAGPASGNDYGNAVFWGYQMDIPVSGGTYRVTFEDWIWAFDDETIVNRSYIKKFGIVFAEVTIFMRKMPS